MVFDKRKKWLGLFDVIVFSNKCGERKPSERIYRIALKKLKFKPEEVIFIDNLKKNADGAKKTGMNAIWFKNARQLKRELKVFGISNL